MKSESFPRSALFGVAIGTSAFTLFLIEPLMGKRLLPVLGGSSSVWLVSLVFFQTALLVGYLAAFLLGRLPLRTQLLVQPLAILASLAICYPFPIAVPAADASPEATTLLLLLRSIGAPFAVLAANATLLQSWAAKVAERTPVTAARSDVYGLYSASNLGSLLALFAFPCALEPFFGLAALMRLWSVVYAATALLVGGSAWVAWNRLGADEAREAPSDAAPSLPSARTWLPWCAYAFLPSALLSAVTNVLVSDVGSVPLLWTIPLGIYLLTYVFAFRPRGGMSGFIQRYFPFVAVVASVALFPGSTLFSGGVAVVLFLFLFFGGYLSHRTLWDMRPPSRDLPVFYLVVSLGGALGGAFVGLLAPRLFSSNDEFPILFVLMVVVGVRAAIPNDAPRPGLGARDVAFAAAIALVAYGVLHLHALVWVTACLGALSLVIYSFRDRAWRFSLCLLALVVPAKFLRVGGKDIVRTRNYYGSLVVFEDDGERDLRHGTTIHGLTELAHPEEPWTYYSRGGVVGASFRHLHASRPGALSCAFVGLGVGTMLAYVRPEDSVTVFEIDPDIVRVASDERLFPFVAAANRRTPVHIQLGDARRMLESVGAGTYDLLALDAFSSDSIPVHLLTTEAFTLYRHKLREHGVILVHISNRYFRLQGIVARLGQEVGMPAFIGVQPESGLQSAAKWVWVGENPPPDWKPVTELGERWTDDFSSPMRVLK